MTIQSSDRFQVQSGSTQYSDSASNLRSGVKSYDHLLVRRGSTNYKLPKIRRYDVEYTDRVLVNRSNTNYLETGQNYLDYMWTYTSSALKGSSFSVPDTQYGARIAASEGIVGLSGRPSPCKAGVYDLDGTARYSKIGTGDQFGYSCAAGDGKFIVTDFIQRQVYVYNLFTGNLEVTISQPSIQNFGVWVAVGDGIITIIEDASTGTGTGGVANGSCYVYDLSGNFITRIFCPEPYTASRVFVSYIGGGKLILGVSTSGGSSSNNGMLNIYNSSTRAFETTITGAAGDRLGYVSSTSVSQYTVASGLLVSGTWNQAVRVYNLSGTLLFNIPKPAAADSGGWGKSVVAGAGRIFVLDSRNGNFGATKVVYIYDLSGNLINSLNFTGNGNSSGALAMDTGLGCCVFSQLPTSTTPGGFFSIGNTQK